MIITQVLVMNKKFLILIISFCASCISQSVADKHFRDTFDAVLSSTVKDFRYNNPPTFEEFKKGIEKPFLEKKPDSLSPLKVIVSKNSVDFDFHPYLNRIPLNYQFVMKPSVKGKEYVPEELNEYLSEDFQVTFKVDPHKTFVKYSGEGLDHGGMLQLGKIFINDEETRAIMWARITRSKLDGTETIILFEKVEGVWKIKERIGISMS
ncbi:MAG TPA: hypothetical protein VFM70_05460 [Salinimicrobium sp.]|nr:hypothetical protein [Salinimicrobium sp.]